MQGIYLTQTIREAEERKFTETAPGELMQRAATGLAVRIAKILRNVRGGLYGASLLIVAGTGNNGGDGLYAGAWLAKRGAAVRYWKTGASCHRGGEAALLAAGGRELTAPEAEAFLADCDLVVDAVLGIGGRGGLREPLASFAARCGTSRAIVVSVDLPSGLTADETSPSGPHFVANHTVTFGGLKILHTAEPAKSSCGEIHLIDIGLEMSPDLRLWEAADVGCVWPVPGPSDHKYSRGVVGLDVGSAEYPGAAVLAAIGATGAGMVRIRGAAANSVVAALPNVVAAAGRVQALLIGSGWGLSPEGTGRVAAALAENVPTVIDADALRYLPEHLPAHCLLTPHPGELVRMLGVEHIDPIPAVRAAAQRYGCPVLLKGSTQYLATQSGDLAIAVPGPAWTGQAGSGDVLAGMAAALLATGMSPDTAGLTAASVQALTAARYPGPLRPHDLATHFPAVIAELVADRARQ